MTNEYPHGNDFEELNMLFAQLTHELRAPTTVLRGCAELLERELAGPLNEDQRELVQHMSRVSRSVTHTIQQFIALHGALYYPKAAEMTACPVHTLVEDAVSWAKRSNPDTTVDINVVHLPEQVEVFTDPEQARVILFQLVDNAIKFNVAKGFVRVSVQSVEQAVVIDVQDTGKGIGPEYQTMLFVKHHPVPFTEPHLPYGTGFGLRIAYLLAQASNITVSLTKSDKEGSIFRVVLEIHQK